MTVAQRRWTRRRFLGIAAASTAVEVLGGPRRAGAEGESKPRNRRMILSFYCDDTSPRVAGARAFETFLDYCAKQGIAGEASAILGTGGHSMCRDPDEEEKAFLRQVARAWDCGIDTHMELMTHQGLFDFDANRVPDGAVHEGLWLHEPAVTVDEYQRYFGAILAEGQRAGVRFTGLTWPGCSCEACTRRYAELRAAGQRAPNPAMWQALLNLAKEGKLRGRTVPCFFDSSESDGVIHRKASDGPYGVYDLMPNALDRFGIWENNPQRVDPDYHITEDGKSGIIVRHLQAGAPYCVWYAHWQGLNPAKGVGWPAFTTVVNRIQEHLRERVVWLRPSDITSRYHAAGGWGFLEQVSLDVATRRLVDQHWTPVICVGIPPTISGFAVERYSDGTRADLKSASNVYVIYREYTVDANGRSFRDTGELAELDRPSDGIFRFRYPIALGSEHHTHLVGFAEDRMFRIHAWQVPGATQTEYEVALEIAKLAVATIQKQYRDRTSR